MSVHALKLHSYSWFFPAGQSNTARRTRKCRFFASLRMTDKSADAVMLSAAKHLQFRPRTNPMQILRFAQNDRAS